ncbi:hypothetical protein D1Z90_04475 [Motilimonas pumila]|uniref:PAS domain S-box protein n=2 Tax=Motilimonas pumila TaxID=2303987 RepID=A0A418YHV2_9GAMM|nr:hypothetical protein D1Z90_04475 [Motilimonas pumila]
MHGKAVSLIYSWLILTFWLALPTQAAERDNLNIGVAKKGWAPFELVENGQPSGYLVDYMELVAKQADISINWHLVKDRAALLQAAQSGEHDLITYGAKVDKYRDNFVFGKEILPRYITAFKNEAKQGQFNLDTIANWVVASPKDYQTTRLLQQRYPEIKIYETLNVSDSIVAVASGQADIAFADLAVGQDALGRGFFSNIVIEPAPGYVKDLFLPIHILYNNALPAALIDRLETAREQISPGEVTKLQDKWRLKANFNGLSLTDEELTWIASAPPIKIPAYTDLDPFSFEKDGKVVGFTMDYIQLLSKKTGLKFEVVKGHEWTEHVLMAQGRHLDILHMVRRREDLAQFMTFSTSYLTSSPMVLYSREEQQEISSIEQLKGLTLAVTRDYIEQRYISEHYPEQQLLLVDSTGEGLNAVLKGDADYYLCGATTCDTYIYQNFLSNLAVTGHLGIEALSKTQAVKMAVRSDWPILTAIIDKAILSVTPNELKQLKDKWLTRVSRERLVIESLTKEEEAWIRNNRRLAFSSPLKAAPFGFITDDEELGGIAYDILRRFQQQYDIDIHLVKYNSWPNTLNALIDGSVDFIPTMDVTPERKKHMLFTDPIIDINFAVFGMLDKPIVDDLTDMKNLRIGMTKGSGIAEQLQTDYPHLRLISYGNLQDKILALAEGEVDVIIENPLTIEYQTTLLDLEGIVEVAPTPYKLEIAIGVHPSKPELVSLLNKTLASISDQQMTLIIDKWSHLRVVEKKDWLSILSWVIGTAVILLTTVLLFSYFKRRQTLQVLKRTSDNLKNAQRVAKLGSFAINQENMLLELSSEAAKMLGVAKGKTLSRTQYVQMIAEQDRADYVQALNQALNTGLLNQEYRLITGTGEKWLNEIAELSFDPQGKLVSGAATIQDISLFKASEAEVLENQAELRNLTSKLLSVQEEERKRVARDLHDDLSQRLAVIAIDAGTLLHKVEDDSVKGTLQKIKQDLVRIAEDTHSLSRRLHPSILDDLGLIDALRSEIDNFQKREQIRVDFFHSAKGFQADKDVALVLFRIVQEGLRNIAKYSEASKAVVSINLVKDLLILQVQDDGMGFDVVEAKRSPGLGLQSMMERARLINAELEIVSVENKGTTIELQVPLEQSQQAD